MPRVVTNIKRLFKRSEIHEAPPFKQPNALNLLSESEIRSLIAFAEERHFWEAAPSLRTKKVLWIASPATDRLLSTVMEEEPEYLVHYGQAPDSPDGALAHTNYQPLKGELAPLPLKAESFDVAMLPFGSYHPKALAPIFSNIAKPLASAGRMLVSIVHPTLEYFLYNQNPASNAKVITNLQDTVALLRANNLYLENLTEAFIDADTKPFFMHSDDSSFYEELKGIPLVLFLRCVKFVKA